MDRRKFLQTGTGLAGFGLAAGCIGGDGGSTDTPSGPVTIGAIEPLSGPFSPWGDTHLSGLEFALGQINADGGVMGRELEVVSEDTESRPSNANNAFRRLANQEGIVAATGPVSSDVGIRTSRTAESIAVPVFMHMAGSDAYTSKDNRYTFRVGQLPAPTYTGPQEQIINDGDYTKVGAIIADYAWGQAIKSAIQEFETDVQTVTVPMDASNFSSAIRQFPQDLSVMIASGHPPGVISIFSQMRELGYRPEITTDSGWPPSVIWDAIGELATEGMGHNHLTDLYSDAFRETATAFADATDQRMDSHVGYGYVTGQLIASAIENAGSTDPGDIADAVRSIKLDTLYANPLEYTDYGEQKNQQYIFSRFETGEPRYYAGGEFTLSEFLRTDPIPAYDPSG
jgi:branched-chain amino acid transport system substrate-binding protein